jgi:hypothetical protein
MGEPIQVGRMIAQSIKRMITSTDNSIGHPFVISHLCELAGVLEEDDAHIIGPLEPLGARFRARAQRDLETAVADQQGHQQPQEPHRALKRIQGTEMSPLAKLWSRWWIHNFEACSNQTEIITSRCLGIYSILMGEPIQVGRVIAQSIRRMITSSEATIGDPFVISHLCSLAGVPEEDNDDIIGPEIPLGARFLSRAQRDFERAQQGQQQPPP